jgi:mono/diheme cytochrome c family protein
MVARRFIEVLVLTVSLVPGTSGRAAAQAAPPSKAAIDMSAHFAEVGTVHEAIIRGDLAAARAAASALAQREFAGLPESTAPDRQAMKTLASRVAAATDVQSAAAGTASMLGACGDCHRAAGVVPAPALPDRPVVGQTVGHMLDHQRAADQLMQGLVVPSSALWHLGAQGLRGAPLGTGKLPKDHRLTADVAAAEQRVHALAEDAAAATEPAARAAVYGQVLGTCASCHSLHSTIWGPAKR